MIVDCFPFFNELDVLEIRLRELDGLVDRFVAVQSVETHAGALKPVYLDPADDRWKPWAGRLETVVLPAMPHATDRWQRENATRHVLNDVLASASPVDLVLMSDVDEVPSARTVHEMLPEATVKSWVGFTMPCYYYYLNLRTPKRWRAIALARVQTVRELGAQTMRDARRRPPTGPILGGWHFSYLGGVERIIEKLSAFAHAEYDTAEMKNPAFLAERIASRHDLFGATPKRFVRTALAELPHCVQADPARYAHLVLEDA